MDKNTYETYEYLSANSSDTDQFFVVQDDGTFLINRQVQYVTQVQDVKQVLEGVQSCRVYDVTPEQLLVDVDSSTELISVSDQYVLPNGTSNLYPNSYLIQPDANMSTQQMQQSITLDQYKPPDTVLNMDIVQNDKPTTNNCTEITLSDEQYQMLEQKGWILLETNDKIYLLDTLGLHDITTNTKLIQKLKSEKENDYNNATDVNRATQLQNNILGNVSELPNKELSNFNVGNHVSSSVNQNSTDNILFGRNRNDEVIYTQENIDVNKMPVSKPEPDQLKEELHETDNNNDDTGAQILVIENDDIHREGSTLKIKTKLSLKNFPEKLVLGKTINGKKLVARVIKLQVSNHKPMEVDKNEPKNPQSETVNERKFEVDKNPPAIHLSNLLNETEFLSLIQHLVKNNITRCCADDIVSADSVIAQLLQIPAFKSTVIDSYLVITKTVQIEDSLENIVNKGLSAVITGKVSENNNELHFVHLPNMLQNMLHLCVFPKNNSGSVLNASKKNFDVLHVQLTETKHSATNVVKVSVTVNKRTIPINLFAYIQKNLSSTLYACSACAALFKSEDLLKEHQVNHCLEPDDVLTIDTDEQPNSNEYCVVDSGKTKTYACMQCNAKFRKLNACKNHLKTHAPKVQDNEGSKTENKSNEVYKCNMCPCTYFHPSTLSKHILSRHIKMKT